MQPATLTAAAADSTLASLLPGGLDGLPATLQDLLDTLAQCCAALQLADTRPAALAAAALQAATDAQAAQDAEVRSDKRGLQAVATQWLHIACASDTLAPLSQHRVWQEAPRLRHPPCMRAGGGV